jgi:hypothetical protein
MRTAIVPLALAFFIVVQVTAAAAVRCDGLQPIPPQNTDQHFTGKLNVAVDGWFAKLAKVGGTAEGTYQEVANNVLPNFPQADRLYMWERVLYLKCQLIADSKDLSTQQKLNALDGLSQAFATPPPAVAAASTINNSGDNAKIIQGSHNSIK